MVNRLRRTSLSYAFALAMIALAAGLNLALWRWLAPQASPLFLAAVVASAWRGGLGPGMLAGVAAAVVIKLAFVDQSGFEIEDVARASAFLASAGFISSLTNAQRRVRESERLRRVWYEAMLRSVDVGVIATDPEGRVAFLNAAAGRLTGREPELAIGRPIDEVLPIRDERNGRKSDDLIAQALRDGRTARPEHPIVLVDRSGGRTPIDGHVAPIRHPEGETIGAVVVFRDATDRRRSEERMAEHAAIVACSQDAIISKGLDERILSWNPGAERLFGYSADEAIGRPSAILLPPDCTDEMPRMLTRIEDGLTISHYETERIRKDGHRVDISVSVSPLKDGAGKVVGTSTIARDVTHRRQAERRLSVQYDVSRILSDSATLGRAIPRLLEALGRGLHWEMGIYWSADIPAGVLRCDSIWHVGGLAYGRFEKLCARSTCGPNEGLPGRAWQSGHPEWIAEVGDDGHFSRSALAMAAGLHRGIAFPVIVGDRTIGVVEFLGGETGPPDDTLMGMLRVVGAQIGQFAERRRSEAGWKIAEARFRRLWDSGILGIILVDLADRKVRDANRAFLEMIDASTADVAEGRLNLDAMTPDDHREADARAVADLLASGVCDPYVKQYVGPGGRQTSALVGFARLDESSSLCIGFLIDITERRRTEEALLHREEQLRMALDVARMGSWDWNIATGEVEWSDNLETIHGMPPGSFGGSFEAFLQIVHPDDREPLKSGLECALADAAEYDQEFRVITREGGTLWMSGRGRVLRDAAGKPVRMIGVGLDITERKKAQDDLLALSETAISANLAKDQFLAVLSHELRTPLTPVLAAVAAMIDDPSTPDDFRDVLRMVRRNVGLEARLIDDLLDITKIANGKLRLSPEVVDAHELIYQALEICIEDVRLKGLRLDVALDADRHHVQADPARLQQVYWNLIKNAVKFTPTGGRLSIRSRIDDDELVVEVADTGRGIDPEVLPRIFNAFEQGEASVTRRFGGLGLGLAISKSVIDLHGGTLGAASEGLGRGATFSIAMATVEPAADRGVVPVEASGEAASPVGPLRVLLVEDNEDSLQILARLLRLAGHQVATADTIAAAMEHVGSAAFDLLVSDLGLPDGSGLDLIRRIFELRPIPAIALSGYGMESDLARSREAGFLAHLIKPIDYPQLEAAIGRVMEAARSPNLSEENA